MTTGDIQYLTEALAVDLAEMLSKDFNMSILESLDTLYNSETYQKLTNPDTGLYFQSAQQSNAPPTLQPRQIRNFGTQKSRAHRFDALGL